MRAVYVPPRPAWMDEADCAGIGSDWWYPRAREDRASEIGRDAKRICVSCPVRLECLEYALSINEEWGIWGGLTPGERRKIPRGVPLTADLLDRLGWEQPAERSSEKARRPLGSHDFNPTG